MLFDFVDINRKYCVFLNVKYNFNFQYIDESMLNYYNYILI